MNTEISKTTLLDEQTKNQNVIVVFNDDVNTFDHVINCLIIFCNHEIVQAEQCALIVHNNGKCEVKTGDYEELRPMCESLLENGITAEIQ